MNNSILIRRTIASRRLKRFFNKHFCFGFFETVGFEGKLEGKKVKPVRLVICGNGLDLHLGFKTDYQSYRQYLNDNMFIDGKSAISVIEESPFFLDRDADCWTDLESSLTFDCEKYISSILNAFDRNLSSINPDASKQQIDAAKAFDRADPEKIAFEFTNQWFFEWIAAEYYSNCKRIAAEYHGILETLIGRENMYLTFNYTPTLEDIFCIPGEQIFYIHNRFPHKKALSFSASDLLNEVCESSKKKFQFGSTKNSLKQCDELLEKVNIQSAGGLIDKKQIERKVRGIYLSFTKTLSDNYNELENFIKKNKINEVVILGHSFFGVDRPYYNDIIIPKFEKCHWNIFCHQSCESAKNFVAEYNLENFELTMW